MIPKSKSAPNIDRMPPYSAEAEQAVIGCMLASPNGCITLAEEKLGKTGDPFYDLRHQSIFCHIVALHDRQVPVDVISLRESLAADNRSLEEVGGAAYLSTLPDLVPSIENLPNYLDIVFEKFTLRRLIKTCTETCCEVYEHQGDLLPLVAKAQAQLLSVLNPLGKSVTQEHWRMKDLISFDVDRDPNAVIGFHDGKTTRYLCRGYAAWLIGQSGIGKSTLGQQQAFMFALGRPFFGITPVRPLRVLIVQNENDQGDVAEATQGILDSSQFTPEEFDALQDRVKVIRCRGKTGEAFCQFFEREVVSWRADISYVDPLLRFAGIDVSRQDQCTRFLNDSLDPVLARTGVVMIGAHHTGKPKTGKETQGWTIYDYAYSGIGSSELVNWARAISIIRVLPEGNFELMLAKRGSRAWAVHPNGEATTSIFLRHSKERIFWEQVDPPLPTPTKSSKAGRPSKLQEIASMNLFEFCAACKPEGEGLREICQRLESYLAKQRVDISGGTTRRAVAALIANGKLLKSDAGTYLKGKEA